VKRREFITLLGGAAAWPLAARAQQSERVRRVGALIPADESDPVIQLRLGGFREGLQKLGWTEGGNLRIDYRWGGGSIERTRTYAAELVALKPDVIFGPTTSAAVALHRETRTIPVVFAQVTDPVALGLVESLSRPGGNITGFAVFEYAIALKWLELLKQIAPHVTRIAIPYDPELPSSPAYIRTIEATAPSFRVEILPHPVRDAGAMARAIEIFVAEPNGGPHRRRTQAHKARNLKRSGCGAHISPISSISLAIWILGHAFELIIGRRWPERAAGGAPQPFWLGCHRG